MQDHGLDATPGYPSRPDPAPGNDGRSSDDTRAPLEHHGPATERNAAYLRSTLQNWLARDVPADIADDLVLVTYEALANAVDHAYPAETTGPRPVWLQARRTADHVLVTVADQGTWREPSADSDRGRGIAVMRALSQDADIEHSETGTTVRLSVPAPTRPQP